MNRQSAPPDGSAEPRGVLEGGGEMGALMRKLDWSKTAVGPVDAWPQSLRTALSILLETGFPMYIAWGPSFTQFYNDGYRPILGSTKHPAAMGISTRETFAEIWHIIGPMFEGVMRGTPVTVRDFLLPLDRHGFVEECYFDFSYSPIREETGVVGGVLVTVSETTGRVLGARRLETLRALAARATKAESALTACSLSASVLEDDRADIPFALVYLFDDDRRGAKLAGVASLATPSDLAPCELVEGAGLWPIAEIARGSGALLVDLPDVGAPHIDPLPARALVLPVHTPGEERPCGVLIAALSPRLAPDDTYKSFLELVAGQIGTAIATARALEEAKARAAALAEIDRAKTAFFSSVSHEFRTPLTLMLGPMEDALASEEVGLPRDALQMVHRNGLRLLKLVNALLDFARIEAGRVKARYEPTDVAALTADVASAFRSAVERAGLTFDVRAEPLPEPIYLDHDMWEKIVLNLISNALKFTWNGSIRVVVAARPGGIELEVSDTGTGIPAHELPRLFERFHRIEGTRARTHEGSGIGLALVQELVRLHGGSIVAESAPGRGATFRVFVPSGTRHLPREHIAEAQVPGAATKSVASFVEEALGWLPDAGARASAEPWAPASDGTGRATILVADDNADMREYLRRILATRWHVETTGDGESALRGARHEVPDVVVTDVMMPKLDGFGLLRELRADERTRRVPVIMLSARAGEEARAEALEHGADDYLVKPFVARELVALVEAQLVRSRMRQLEEEQARYLSAIFQNAPVGIAVLRGPMHLYEFANADYLKLVADRPVLGKPIRDALPELEGQGVFELLDQVYRSGAPFASPSIGVVLNRGPRLEPEHCFFNLVYQPVFQDDGAVSGIVVVATEVTALVKARREAEAASRAKDDFLAILGHELRNPLAPIQTAIELMKLRGGAAIERERTIIERQVRHLSRLVDDLLDVSRLTSGKIELARERVDVAAVIARAVEMTSPILEERHHELRLDVGELPAVLGDPTRLAQVFSNLLMNAAKYTPPSGRIDVSARTAADGVTIEICDSGVGIDPEVLPRIFEPFVQEQQNIARTRGGLGLGLAIVANLVHLHGGTAVAHSEGRGKGARFTVQLPRAPDASELPAPAEPEAAPERSVGYVLVVDDNLDAGVLLSELLQMRGYRVRTATDGPTALDIAAEAAPDIALLDIGLPGMNGYELASAIRKRPELARTKLVAVTGYGQPRDRTASQEAGFDEHLVKPLDMQTLIQVVERLMAPAGASTVRS